MEEVVSSVVLLPPAVVGLWPWLSSVRVEEVVSVLLTPAVVVHWRWFLVRVEEVVSSFVLLPPALLLVVVAAAVVDHLELLCVSMMLLALLLALLLAFPLYLDVTNDADVQTELDSVINDEDATIVLKQQKKEKKLMASVVFLTVLLGWVWAVWACSEVEVVWSWTCYVLAICFLEPVVAVEVSECCVCQGVGYIFPPDCCCCFWAFVNTRTA